MAYAESTIGGSLGGQFRCWVNSIRTHDGGPADNSEDWRVEGGVKRVTSGSRVWNNYNQATYTIQLGMNGVATSGNFNYDTTGAGNIGAWGTGSTKVYRNSAGVGFGFQSRTDINMSNSPYLTSGWVTSNDSVQTKYRHATLTALSMDAGGIPATDEGPLWLEFSNPSGASVDAWLEAPGPGFPRIYTSAGGRTSRFNYPNLAGGSLTTALQNAIPNSNSGTLRIGIHDALGGDNWDYRDRTYTIKNDLGQANPTFSNFTYLDTNAATVAVTGSNQVLIQGKSTLQTTVSVANKATANKGASMSSYLHSIGAYSQSAAWSNVADVVQNIGLVSDVSGDQTLNVRAIDSRGNGTTVSKSVTVLPYYSPGFYNNLSVSYANDFDIDDGISLTLFDTDVIGSVAPMTLSGVDKNAVTPTTGIRFDIAKDTGSYTGTWTNVAFTQEAGTGLIHVTPATLATQIESKINAMGADNTVRWYVLFEIQDKLETQYYTVEIDVGEPFFRIGADGRLYYKEIEFFQTFSGRSDFYYPSLQAYSTAGSYVRGSASGFTGGWTLLNNNVGALNDTWIMDIYMPAGVYLIHIHYFGTANGAQVDIDVNGTQIGNNYELYNATSIEKVFTSGSLGVLDGATYTLTSKSVAKNASSGGYQNAVVGVKCERIGDL